VQRKTGAQTLGWMKMSGNAKDRGLAGRQGEVFLYQFAV
jgi:hypothetical protein